MIALLHNEQTDWLLSFTEKRDCNSSVIAPTVLNLNMSLNTANYGRFAYWSFRLRSVRLRLESIRLRLICQFAYVLKHVLQQLIHLLYVRSRSDPSRSIQFLERDS